MPETTASTLLQLLDDGARIDPEYGDGLSNHLPMALAALARLGAGPRRLRDFADAYARQKPLREASAPAAWPAGDPWQGRFGERAAWPAYRSLFREWLAHETAAPVLRQALPPLMRGCGGAAFHGLIRTAYALQCRHGGELADALAYWACRWMDLGEPQPGGRTVDPWGVLKVLAIAPTKEPLIALRMLTAARRRAFEPAAAALRLDAGSLPRLARLAARLYARSGNFTALHLVTSAHALRVLLPFIEEPVPALGCYWRAVVAGFVASRLSPAALGRAPPPRPWSELVGAALASDDDHLIKLVDACREEQQAHGGAPDWQRAATRGVMQAAA